MRALLKFLSELLSDNAMSKASFGRAFAIPFLLSAWVIGSAAGVMGVRRGESVIEEVITLASIGIVLYTGSKTLSLRGQKVSFSMNPEQQ